MQKWGLYVLCVSQIKKCLNSKMSPKSLQGYVLGQVVSPLSHLLFLHMNHFYEDLDSKSKLCVKHKSRGVLLQGSRWCQSSPFSLNQSSRPYFTTTTPQSKAQILMPLARHFCLFMVISPVVRFTSVRFGHRSFAPQQQQVDLMLALWDSTHY